MSGRKEEKEVILILPLASASCALYNSWKEGRSRKAYGIATLRAQPLEEKQVEMLSTSVQYRNNLLIASG